MIGVAGGGAWGTALANAAALAGRDVVLWLRDPVAAEALARTRENARYLPGVRLHERVRPTGDAAGLAGCAAVLLVVPAQTVRAVAQALAPHLGDAPLVICAKGIERGTGRFLSEAAAEVRPGAPVAVLSGPSFADDVARGLPTAVTLACADGELAAALAAALSGPSLRLYHGTDVRGVEIGGAAKNVLAIACGAVVGRGLGESAKAALTARGFAELLRFAAAHGGRAETLMGLSGLGDLVLTCGSAHSRNFAFGERLGAGAPVEEAAQGRLVEGASTAPVLVELARAAGVDMPIAEAVAAVVAGRATVDEAIAALLSRPLKAEH
ncbi:MAG TPA: NAD(P)H-dependent glycerol-3-phosphate dehydrogenase [Beijerinckiaceae bacterium]|nr:NAD(P)H-dependent glycerol-3-phosphate dehydrogenase [Beijerinckiaceae bacterium]